MPITQSTTWTYFASSEPCVYRMRVYSELRWVWFINDADDWYWLYQPVANTHSGVAFEYGGLQWAYGGEGALVGTETGTVVVEECPEEVTPDMWWC